MEDLNEMYETENDGFKIDSDNLCDWAIRRIKEERDEAERIKAIALAQIEDLQNKIKAIDERTDHRTAWLKGRLQEYFETVPHKETKTQESYKLLSGTLIKKRVGTKIAHDDEVILEWVKANAPSYIKVKESLDWAGFKKELELTDNGAVVLEDTGEVIPGVSIEIVPESFEIKF